MPLQIDHRLTPAKLRKNIERFFDYSGQKILALEKSWDPSQGTPVFTVRGRYSTRGWTEWTQGFQFGAALLQYDATGETEFLELGRDKTIAFMASHVSHTGVHDHGFNNVSTYGNLLRLSREGKFNATPPEQQLYELALKVSGAVQAARWTRIADGSGFICSFNGPHSLFVDTIRSLRVLALADRLGHVLMGEHDERISLLGRLLEHVRNTARFNVYYGKQRDAYDVRGRTVHECIFNVHDGRFRCPSSQQGYSPFTTWTRGLAWALCGFAEQLEFLATLPARDLNPFGGRKANETMMREAATATADFYLQNSCRDGIPYWDTGAPGLHHCPDHLEKSSDPCNPWEPVDSSAAAIAAQGLIRLGHYLRQKSPSSPSPGKRYYQAGLTIARTLMNEPYLSTSPRHQGLVLHSIYHRPNGWDYIPPKQKIPCGESSMWGDYHARELALMILREARGDAYLTFFGGLPGR